MFGEVGPVESGYKELYWCCWPDWKGTCLQNYPVVIFELLQRIYQLLVLHQAWVRNIYSECQDHVFKVKPKLYGLQVDEEVMVREYSEAMKKYFSAHPYLELFPENYYGHLAELFCVMRAQSPRSMQLVPEFMRRLEKLQREVLFEVFIEVRKQQQVLEFRCRELLSQEASIHNFTEIVIPEEFSDLLSYGPKFSFGLMGSAKGRVRSTLKLMFHRFLYLYMYEHTPKRPLSLTFRQYEYYFHNPVIPSALRDSFYDIMLEYSEYLYEGEHVVAAGRVVSNVQSGSYEDEEAMFPALQVGERSVRDKLFEIRRSYSALMRFLKEHPDHVIIASDKGCGFCYLPLSYFVTQYSSMITESPNYQSVTLKEVEVAYGKYNSTLKDFLESLQPVLLLEGEPISECWLIRLLKPRVVETPSVNLFPKVHKLLELPNPGMSVGEIYTLLVKLMCRPIVTGYGGISAVVEKFLAEMIRYLIQLLVRSMADVGFPRIIPKSTECILEAVVQAETLQVGQSLIFIKYDFTSLYTNIRKDDVLQSIRDCVQRFGVSLSKLSLMEFLVGLVFSNNYVQVGGSYYRAADGCPMGSYASRDMADLILLCSELRMAAQARDLGVFSWLRWIDDGFALMRYRGEVDGWNDASRFVYLLRKNYPCSLEFEVELSRTAVTILDYKLYNVVTPWRGLYYVTYFKEASRKMVQGPLSCHTLLMKRGIVKTETRRFMDHSSTAMEYDHCVSVLEISYLRSGYSREWYRGSVMLFVDKQRNYGSGDRPLCEYNVRRDSIRKGDPHFYLLYDQGKIYWLVTMTGEATSELKRVYYQKYLQNHPYVYDVPSDTSQTNSQAGFYSIRTMPAVYQILRESGEEFVISSALHLENLGCIYLSILQWRRAVTMSWMQHVQECMVLSVDHPYDGCVTIRKNSKKPGECGRELLRLPVVHELSSMLPATVKRRVSGVLKRHRVKTSFYFPSVNTLGEKVFTKRRFHERLSGVLHSSSLSLAPVSPTVPVLSTEPGLITVLDPAMTVFTLPSSILPISSVSAGVSMLLSTESTSSVSVGVPMLPS
jgi:hypothetical protein